MKMTLSKIFNLRPVRFLIAAFIGAVLLFSNALPTLAVSSRPSQGEDQLQQIEQKSKDVLKSNPRSLKESQKDAENGLNTVQGQANKEKMKNPGNTDATSIKDMLQQKLDNVAD
jgi:hypothetical protein